MLPSRPGSTNKPLPTWQPYLKRSIDLPSVSWIDWPSEVVTPAATLPTHPTLPPDEIARYRLRPAQYTAEKLGWVPWRGTPEHPGQDDVLEAYVAALRAQLEHPETPCQNRLRIEAGHTVGKTKLAAAIVNHFFDCFPPAIIYTFAPTWEQIHDLLWKEIKSDRRGSHLPGRILDLELKVSDNHFAKGKATNNAGGQGTERAQGQHGPYLLFVLDEAEGIDDYVWDAVESMTSGGLSIVLMLANPRTRISRFHKAAEDTRVASFRISCIHHPNVLEGREVVPGAVRRQYVESMVEQHCETADAHDPDSHTFTLPWRAATIYRPDPEFMFRVLGLAPANSTIDTFVPSGRYEAACKRQATTSGTKVRYGVDCARFGDDVGTLYRQYGDEVRRIATFPQQRTGDYVRAIREDCRRVAASGVTNVHVRVDGGGGFGSGIIDGLLEDLELSQLFAAFEVHEVHFNATPYDAEAYADLATEIYSHTADVLRSAALINVPPALETDLCERRFKWVKAGPAEIKKDVKKIRSKVEFRADHHRSPDDGDGCALACAPDYVFDRAPGPDFAPTVGGARSMVSAIQRGRR